MCVLAPNELVMLRLFADSPESSLFADAICTEILCTAHILITVELPQSTVVYHHKPLMNRYILNEVTLAKESYFNLTFSNKTKM